MVNFMKHVLMVVVNILSIWLTYFLIVTINSHFEYTPFIDVWLSVLIGYTALMMKDNFFLRRDIDSLKSKVGGL